MQDTDKIKSFQLSMLLLAIIPITKFILMPAVAASVVGRDSWLPTLILLTADVVIISFMLLFSKRNPDVTFKMLLNSSVGKTASTIVLNVYAVYFLLKCVLPISELRRLLIGTLYDGQSGIIFLIPLCLLAAYSAVKGLFAIGRSANIIGWLSAISVTVILLLSFGDINFDNLLPILRIPPLSIANSLPTLSIWFGDCAVMIVFLGKISFKGGKSKSVVITAILSALIVLAFIIILTAVYGEITSRQTNAITKISRFNTALTKIGRFDWIPIILLLTAQVFAIITLFFCSYSCLTSAYGLKASNKTASLILAFVLFIMLIFLKDNINALYTIYTGYFAPFVIAMQYALPIFTPLLFWIHKRRKTENATKTQKKP